MNPRPAVSFFQGNRKLTEQQSNGFVMGGIEEKKGESANRAICTQHGGTEVQLIKLLAHLHTFFLKDLCYG